MFPHDLDYCFSQLSKYLKNKKGSIALSVKINALVTPHSILNLELDILCLSPRDNDPVS